MFNYIYRKYLGWAIEFEEWVLRYRTKSLIVKLSNSETKDIYTHLLVINKLLEYLVVDDMRLPTETIALITNVFEEKGYRFNNKTTEFDSYVNKDIDGKLIYKPLIGEGYYEANKLVYSFLTYIHNDNERDSIPHTNISKSDLFYNIPQHPLTKSLNRWFSIYDHRGNVKPETVYYEIRDTTGCILTRTYSYLWTIEIYNKILDNPSELVKLLLNPIKTNYEDRLIPEDEKEDKYIYIVQTVKDSHEDILRYDVIPK